MKKLRWLTTALAIMVPGTVFPQDKYDWSTLDKTLLVASTAVNIVDWGQTRTIAMNPDIWHENNPLLGKHPSLGQVNNYFISRLILVPVLAHYLPEYRTAILSIWLGIGLGYAGHNHSIGLRMSW